MGYGDDGWKQVRKDMLNELIYNRPLYDWLFCEIGRYNELLKILDYFEDSPAGIDKWMTLPDMGHIITSCYNVVLISLSSNLCLTFLPLRSVPEPLALRKTIAITFVNGNYFVKVTTITFIENALYNHLIILMLLISNICSLCICILDVWSSSPTYMC